MPVSFFKSRMKLLTALDNATSSALEGVSLSFFQRVRISVFILSLFQCQMPVVGIERIKSNRVVFGIGK